jgi:hypothetical protein
LSKECNVNTRIPLSSSKHQQVATLHPQQSSVLSNSLVVGAELARTVANLLGLTTASTPLIHNTRVISVCADIDKCSRVTIVGIDAHDLATVIRGSAFNVHIPLTLLAAVAAGTIDLAIVFSIEVDDVDSSAAVMLNDLVRSMIGSAANNPCLLAFDIIFL